ncbi:MAG: Gfo/Idh/MocA family protein [Thermomicrobiales bacterium]
MTTETLRAAIIGTGRIGSTYDDEVVDRRDPASFRGAERHVGLYTVLPVNHAGAYRTTAGFDLIAAANRGAEKLRAFGDRWGVRALYEDYRAMLREERPDVVSVCTRSPEKAAIVVAAAEAGARAIIVEKAMATSMAEADVMLAACERHNVLLAVNHPYRFSPLCRAAKAQIDDGTIGTPGTVSAFAVGGMLHVGTHTFDLLRFWAGDVVEVTARMPDYAPEQDLPATGTLRFASGVDGFFDHVHRVQPGYEARGTTGQVAISALVGDGWLSRIEPFAAGARHYPSRLRVEPIEGGPHTISPTQRLLTELHATLTTGVPFLSTGRDGAAALELGLACFLSHLAGGPVRLPLQDRTFRVPNR